eukprot:scaffold5132_cov65-Phaeocystis_antarctica.AAC.7
MRWRWKGGVASREAGVALVKKGLSHELGHVEDPVAERQTDAVDVEVLHLLQLALGDPRVPVLRKGFWSRLLRQPKLHGWAREVNRGECGDNYTPHPPARAPPHAGKRGVQGTPHQPQLGRARTVGAASTVRRATDLPDRRERQAH